MQNSQDSEITGIRSELQEAKVRAQARESHIQEAEQVAEHRHAEAVGLLRQQLSNAMDTAQTSTRSSESQPCSICPIKDAQINSLSTERSQLSSSLEACNVHIVSLNAKLVEASAVHES